LYEKIFGDIILDKLLRREDERLIKNLLKEVYGYKDIDYIVPDRLEYKKLREISKIIFKFYENKEDNVTK
jgi:hypothetical protein